MEVSSGIKLPKPELCLVPKPELGLEKSQKYLEGTLYVYDIHSVLCNSLSTKCHLYHLTTHGPRAISILASTPECWPPVGFSRSKNDMFWSFPIVFILWMESLLPAVLLWDQSRDQSIIPDGMYHLKNDARKCNLLIKFANR